MKDKQLYLYWLYLFIICAALGFIQDRSPLGVALLTVVGLGFFVPPALLVYRDIRAKQRRNLIRVALLSGCSLLGTVVLFIVYWFLLTTAGSDVTANIAYAALTVLASPMMCVALPALSLFGWACLLIASILYLKKEKSPKKQ